MRLEINYREKTIKKHKHTEANNILLNNQEITEEIKEQIKKTHTNKWLWKHDDPKCSKSSSKEDL